MLTEDEPALRDSLLLLDEDLCDSDSSESADSLESSSPSSSSDRNNEEFDTSFVTTSTGKVCKDRGRRGTGVARGKGTVRGRGKGKGTVRGRGKGKGQSKGRGAGRGKGRSNRSGPPFQDEWEW